MSTDQPSSAREPQPSARLSLQRLLRRGAVTARGQRLGRLVDVIVRLPAVGYPEVTGVVADVGTGAATTRTGTPTG